MQQRPNRGDLVKERSSQRRAENGADGPDFSKRGLAPTAVVPSGFNCLLVVIINFASLVTLTALALDDDGLKALRRHALWRLLAQPGLPQCKPGLVHWACSGQAQASLDGARGHLYPTSK